VISGIPEERDGNIMQKIVADVLEAAAKREIQVADAFRLGGRYVPGKTRPVLVKLHSVWDKRIVLNGARNLADNSHNGRFQRIFLAADEPLDVRRRLALERLKKRATREGKAVDVKDGILSVNGVALFSLQSGLIRTLMSATETAGTSSSSVAATTGFNDLTNVSING